MIAKNWTRWTTLLLISTLTISGCSMFGTKQIEVSSKPIEANIPEANPLKCPIQLTPAGEKNGISANKESP